ncbi:DNA-directed DNA polymerase [Tanacetum coccineum]
MTRSTTKKLTEPLDKPEREFCRLRRAAWCQQQNESLAIARRNLFNDKASSSNNTGAKPLVPSKTLREHSLPSSAGLKSENSIHHIKHYSSIVDKIQADGATRDMSRLHFFHFSLKGKAKEWLNKIHPTQITTWDQLVARFLDYFFLVGRAHEADECDQNNSTEQVCLSGGDIYDEPSLLRFYQNNDVPPWENSRPKEVGENGLDWVVRSKFEDELAGFMLKKKFYMKGLGEMFDQYRRGIHEQFS